MSVGTSTNNSPTCVPVALSIAGFDPSSGAGITADLQVFAANGLYGTACITALTVQSTQGVLESRSVSDLVGATLAHLEADLPPSGIKIGMMPDAAAVSAVSAYLREHRHLKRPVVFDPVMVASSGKRLIDQRAIRAIRDELLPLVDWLTPNLAELGELSGLAVSLDSDVEGGLRRLVRDWPHLHIVATGGDSAGQLMTDRLLTPDGRLHLFSGARVDTTSTHGTGCAFSSALLSRLVLRDSPSAAVQAAKGYVTEALRQAPGLGRGRGPLHLLWPLRPHGA